MKFFYIAFILALTSIIDIPIQAQTPGGPCAFDIRLSSQNDVDKFNASYGCTEITGTLTIESSTIFNLDSLYILTSVGGLVLQNNTNLPNIDGLAGLETIGAGGILVYQNTSLTNINGLSHVFLINGTLEVSDNDRLKNIDGLQRLRGAVDQVRFIGNDSLTNLDGASSLGEIDDDSQLVISNNLALTSIAGLESLFRLEYLEISGNPSLPNLTGLESLTSIGVLNISSNNALTEINGLSGLTVVRPNNLDGDTQVSIHHNEALQNIDGLRQVTTVGRPSTATTITISFNPSLTNLDGFSSMGLISGFTKRLNVLWNTSLTDYCGLYKTIDETTASGACPHCIRTDFSNNAVDFDIDDILFNCIPDEEKCHDVSLSTQEAVDAFPPASWLFGHHGNSPDWRVYYHTPRQPSRDHFCPRRTIKQYFAAEEASWP